MINLWLCLFVHMEHWFDKAWLLWEEGGDEESDVLLRLTEDFFDALMVSDSIYVSGGFNKTMCDLFSEQYSTNHLAACLNDCGIQQ